MRFVIYGVGAIGGALAVKLTQAGYDVVGIARGAQLDAIRRDGLRLRTPEGDLHARFPVAAHPAEIDFQNGDVIILTMKTQHTGDALQDLRAAGVRHQPVMCAQNGVANEPMALRCFDNVFGVMVDMPVSYLQPGEVVAFLRPRLGLLEIGRYPAGASEQAAQWCAILNEAGFLASAQDDIMRRKYGKILINLGSGIDVAMGPKGREGTLAKKAHAEALAVYAAAGIVHDDIIASVPQRGTFLRPGTVEGVTPVGSSAAQSLARGAGSIEIDYLNGEIAYLGRVYGVPVPVNAFLTDLAARLLAGNAPPASMTESEVESLFAAWQAA